MRFTIPISSSLKEKKNRGIINYLSFFFYLRVKILCNNSGISTEFISKEKLGTGRERKTGGRMRGGEREREKNHNFDNTVRATLHTKDDMQKKKKKLKKK